MSTLAILVARPLLALLPAALFFGLARWRRGSVVWAAAWAWALYAVYELLMKRRVLCSGECNIRIDLLLLHPALLVLSLVAVVALLRKGTGRP